MISIVPAPPAPVRTMRISSRMPMTGRRRPAIAHELDRLDAVHRCGSGALPTGALERAERDGILGLDVGHDRLYRRRREQLLGSQPKRRRRVTSTAFRARDADVDFRG